MDLLIVFHRFVMELADDIILHMKILIESAIYIDNKNIEMTSQIAATLILWPKCDSELRPIYHQLR